jgi:predicted nucleotidyltransferase
VAFSAKQRHPVHQQPKKDDHELALKFAQAVDKELGDFLKSAVLFGSCATGHVTPLSDIDVLLVVDDVGHQVTSQVTDEYRATVHKVATRISSRFHINTLKLSNFWEYAHAGDPVVINMLRDGVILVDKGFFAPAQLLLEQGRIRPSREAIWTYYARTSTHVRSARQHLLAAGVDLYWAAIDASHAALMSIGETPPTPEHVPDLLEHVLVKRGLLNKRYPRIMRELYHLQKSILHRELKELSGEHYAQYWAQTLELVDALRTIVERHPPQ